MCIGAVGKFCIDIYAVLLLEFSFYKALVGATAWQAIGDLVGNKV